MTADENNPQPVGNPQAASSPQPAASSRWSGLTRHIPPGQFARYLVVGVWNTAFGYATFAFFTAILDKVVPQSYMLASVLSSLINISVSFLGYKWFVFKTKGNYLREWIRCVGVYGGNILFGLAVLPVMVYGLRHYTHLERQAPYVAGAILTFVTVLVSFFGHKHFSFKAKETVQESSK
jgi:putative flippase GtrA